MQKENQFVYTGVIKVGEFDIPCYVVDYGGSVERVLSQREVVKLITGGRESGNLKRYLEARALETTLPPEIRDNYEDNLLIVRAGTTSVHGVRGSTLIDICNAYLKSRQLGLLAPSQVKLAEQSEMFISASAKTGIDAIIDEATGYQYFRKSNELQEKLSAYLQEEYREWTLTFPRQFFMQLYRLEGTPPPIPIKTYPKRFGKYVMRFIYDTMDKDIADYLRENNPNPGGKQHHHQLLNDFGYKTLSDHLMAVLGIMKASINMERFKENLGFAFKSSASNTKNRISKARSESRKKKTSSEQGTLFSYIETVNTPKPPDKE